MSEYKERFEKLEREMAQLKKDVNREEEFVPVMELEISGCNLWLRFKTQKGEVKNVGALSKTAKLEILSCDTWTANFDLFQSQGGTYSSSGVEFKGRTYYITHGVLGSYAHERDNVRSNIYNLKTATPFVDCRDDNIRRTKQTLTPIIF